MKNIKDMTDDELTALVTGGVDKLSYEEQKNLFIQTIDSTRALIRQLPLKEQIPHMQNLLSLLKQTVPDSPDTEIRGSFETGFINIPKRDGSIF